MELPLLSASAIKLFGECQRKWGFKYLEKLTTPPHPSAVLGTEVHADQLGPYLTTGRGFDFTRPSGEIANALAPLLPAPKTPGIRLEREFRMPSPSGRFGYLGFIDLYSPDSACVPGIVGGRPLVGDFKTTSNLNYALTEATLATDTQAQLYAMSIMFDENVDELDLVWFYVRTRRAYRAQRVHLHVTASHVAEQFERIDESAAQVAAIKLASPSVDELPPNPRMCEAYGGCPYRHRCNLAPPVHADAVNREAVEMNMKTNSFLDGLRKQAAPSPVAPTPTAPAPAPAAPPPTAPAAPEPPLPAWATAPVDPMKAKAPINPPESALPPAPPANAAAPSSAPAEAPKRRGRPPKAEQAGTPAAAPTPALQMAPTDENFSAFDIEGLAKLMKACGVKRLVFEGNALREIEVAS